MKYKYKEENKIFEMKIVISIMILILSLSVPVYGQAENKNAGFTIHADGIVEQEGLPFLLVQIEIPHRIRGVDQTATDFITVTVDATAYNGRAIVMTMAHQWRNDIPNNNPGGTVVVDTDGGMPIVNGQVNTFRFPRYSVSPDANAQQYLALLDIRFSNIADAFTYHVSLELTRETCGKCHATTGGIEEPINKISLLSPYIVPSFFGLILITITMVYVHYRFKRQK